MIVGVGLLLFAKIGNIPKIFVIQELKEKPEIAKKRGMLSFPLETFKEVDGNPRITLERLVEEEIGISPLQVLICAMEEEKFHLIPGKNDIVTMYGYGIFLGDPGQVFQPKDNDVIFSGWRTLDELADCFVRVEVCPIIEHFRLFHYEELLRKLLR